MTEPVPISRITTRDIAARLAISQSTVSRALRNHSRISISLRRKIQETANAMGYRPDPMLAALSSYRQRKHTAPVKAALAWLNSWRDPKRLRGYREFEGYWQGASKSAEKLGYRLDEFVVGELTSARRLEEILLTRGIRGILLPPCGNCSIEWGSFNWEHFSVVRFGYTTPAPAAHIVTSDNTANAMLAFDKMREKGYRRIGLVGDSWRRQTFGAAFLWAQRELPEEARLAPFLFPGQNWDGYRQAFSEWLKAIKPDAILTDKAELPGMLAQAGHRVPEDIGLAATTVLDCPIGAGIYSNAEEIGRVAVLQLVSLIDNHERGVPAFPRELLVKGVWVDGPSLPARRHE